MIPLRHLEHAFQPNSRDQGEGRCHWCSLGPEYHQDYVEPKAPPVSPVYPAGFDIWNRG